MIKHKFDKNGNCIYCKFSKEQLDKGVKILDLGCGTNCHEGAYGVDIAPLDEVDMVYDLNNIPYPFDDKSFDLIWMNDILEHLNEPIEIMREAYRLLKEGGKLRIKVVYWNHRFSYADPQHKWAFSIERYFKVFTGEIRSYYLDFHFENLKIDWIFDIKAIQKYGNDPEVLLEKGYFHTNIIQGGNIELTKPKVIQN
jgi:SAM-dependent methyltransferase